MLYRHHVARLLEAVAFFGMTVVSPYRLDAEEKA
jgi:hypothetical protein